MSESITRYYREAHQDHEHDDGRCENETELVREWRHPVFLGEYLDHVRHHLHQTKGANTIRAEAFLPQTKQAAFYPDQHRGHNDDREENGAYAQR